MWFGTRHVASTKILSSFDSNLSATGTLDLEGDSPVLHPVPLAGPVDQCFGRSVCRWLTRQDVELSWCASPGLVTPPPRLVVKVKGDKVAQTTFPPFHVYLTTYLHTWTEQYTRRCLTTISFTRNWSTRLNEHSLFRFRRLLPVGCE